MVASKMQYALAVIPIFKGENEAEDSREELAILFGKSGTHLHALCGNGVLI